MGTIATVTIGTDTFQVYALTAVALTDANSFWNLRLGAAATAWNAATDDDKERGLAAASDWIDRAVGSVFSGTKTVATQAREWPRDDALCDGVAVADGTTPDDIANATFWLAGNIIADPTITDSAGQGSNVKRARAGTAEVEFFSQTIGSGLDTRLPRVATDYLICYFSGAGDFTGFASGVSDASAFSNTDFDRDEGYK